MAKKQKSFADKAAGNQSGESVYVKYVKSVQSEDTGRWRFNEQMVRMNKGEQLDAALKRIEDTANLSDIDLSMFIDSADDGAELKQTGEEKKSAAIEVEKTANNAADTDISQDEIDVSEEE
tara:strand:+ start:531 stop:893 length:363 start_codon:yes stop_codon:yes gene_type:complete